MDKIFSGICSERYRMDWFEKEIGNVLTAVQFVISESMADIINMQVRIMPTEFFLDAYKFTDIIEKQEKW